MHTATTTPLVLPFEGVCPVSGQTLPAGSQAVFIPGEGTVHPSAA